MPNTLSDMLRAGAEMAELRRVAPRLSRLDDVQLIQARPRASTFSAFSDARRVLVKLYHGRSASETAKNAGQALMELNRRLPDGSVRVPEFIELLPKRGIVISEFIEGPTLEALCDETEPGKVAALAEQAAAWLERFSETARGERAFTDSFWGGEAENHIEALTGTENYDLGLRLLARLRDLGALLNGRSVRLAQSHGDFAAQNLIVADHATYGVDIQSLRLAPPERDIARFCLRLAMRKEVRSFPTQFGVADDVLRPFTRRATLTSGDVSQQLLGFYITFDLIERLANTRHRTVPLRTILEAAEACLDHPL